MKKHKKSSLIIVELMYGDTGIIAFLLSIALKFNRSDQKIVGFQTLGSASYNEVFSKYGIQIIRWRLIVYGFLYSLKSMPAYIKYLLSNEHALKDQFSIGDINSFGNFVDTLSIKHGVLWISKRKSEVALDVLFELIHFNYWKAYFVRNHHKIDLMVLGDTAYRYGYLATFSDYYNLPTICNVDLNTLFFNFYHNGFKPIVTKPIYEFSTAEIIKKYPGYEREIDEYFSKRSKGEVLQHDVLKAYRSDKRLELSTGGADKVIIAVFAHIFSDAPHNIPGLLFDSFLEWFIKTIEALITNPNIHILIKEHPSVELYQGEKGLVQKILKEYFNNSENIQIVSSEIKPTEIFLAADYVITASGTVGLEAAYFKKDVIIAAKTPYSNQGIVHEFENRSCYLDALRKIRSIKRLQLSSQSVKLCSFIYFLLFDNRSYYKDFPLRPYIRGEEFSCDINEFDALVEYCTSNNNFSTDFNHIIENKTLYFGPRIDS